MNLDLVGLAALMGLVTYPSRALPMLVPGIERLPRVVLTYLRLVGPAVLASLAAVDVAVATTASGRPIIHLGVEWLAVAVAVGLMAWRRNLLLGLLCAVIVTALARATGLAG